MKMVNCDFCGGTDTTRLYQLRDLKLEIPGEFVLVQCNTCGLLYLNPRPEWDELQQYYEGYHNYLSVEPVIAAFTRGGQIRRCNLIRSYQPGGRLLDVGCSSGEFLKAMQRYQSWELYGVEPVTQVAKKAREQYQLEVFPGMLLESRFPNNFFNVVTWWDVLEHVPNPSESLRETLRILQPGGWAFIQTPDPYCWEARVFKSYWIGFDAPRHLFMFPRPVLTRYLENLGFEIVHIGSFAGNFSTACKSLGQWLRYNNQERLGVFFLKTANSSIARIITAPIYALFRRINLSFSLLYIVRKPNSKHL
jgi:2-polyprenyl-3-methyl-5-hydroxy-6-metoxy-1,4-benzoquinol methylase